MQEEYIMKIKLIRKAGQNGTKKLVSKYGNRLVCIRYRYDEIRKKKYKTIELIIEENDWEPNKKLKRDELVCVQVDLNERELRKRVKKAGGKWNHESKLWEIYNENVVQLGIEDRIRPMSTSCNKNL